MQVTHQQIGIALNCAGTVMVALALRIRSLYGKETNKIMANHDLVAPTDVRNHPFFFWFGLILVIVGSAMQII